RLSQGVAYRRSPHDHVFDPRERGALLNGPVPQGADDSDHGRHAAQEHPRPENHSDSPKESSPIPAAERLHGRASFATTVNRSRSPKTATVSRVTGPSNTAPARLGTPVTPARTDAARGA